MKLRVRCPGTVISAHARTERRKVLRLVLMNPVIRMACKSLLLLPQSTGLAGIRFEGAPKRFTAVTVQDTVTLRCRLARPVARMETTLAMRQVRACAGY